jgi:hypothetical protein
MDAHCEIDALGCVFPDMRVSRDEPDSICLVLKLEPYTGDEESTNFVETGVKLTVGGAYPDRPPSIEFLDSKGLSDQRLACLREEILREAMQQIGEPMLMSICMAGKEYLTAINFPEGPKPPFPNICTTRDIAY